MDNLDKFYHHFEDAKQKKDKRQFQQAKIAYLTALKFSSSIDCVNHHVSALGQLGDVYKDLKLFPQSKNTYLKGIDILINANRSRKIEEKDFMKQKYHLQSNLGLAYSSEIDEISNPFKDHKNIQMLTDSAMKHFKNCQQIVIQMIYKLNQSQWWPAEYAALIANVCTALYAEAFLFKDERIFQLLLNLVQRIQEFTQLFKSNKKLKTNLYKTYFYRALAFKYTNKRQQSEKYFKKDFKYQEQHHQYEDLQKTRQQLILFYEEERNFKQALKYCESNHQKQYIRGKETQFNLFKNRISQIQNKIKNQAFQTDQFEDLLMQLVQKQTYYKDINQFVKRIKCLSAYKKDMKVRFCCQYYNAIANYNLSNYRDAFHQISEALSHTQGDFTQQNWCRILKAQISDKIQPDRKKVQSAYKECLQRAEKSNNKDQIKECQTNIQKFTVYQSRRNRKILFDQQRYRQLVNFLNNKNKQPELSEQIVQHMQIQQPIQKKRLSKNSSLETYLQLCKSNNINPRQEIKQCLRLKQSLNLGSYFNLKEKQILTILSSNPILQTLDLRNHLISQQFLKEASNSQSIIGVRQFKVNCVNGYSKHKINQRYFSYLLAMIKTMPTLNYLFLVNIQQLDFIQRLSLNNSGVNLKNITVLKLKQCYLQDRNLLFYDISSEFPNLTDLSLSHNLIEGSSLGFIKKLYMLNNLNLSYNPLGKVDFGINIPKNKFKKVSIKGLGQLPDQSLERLMCLFMNSQLCDLSHSIQSSCRLLQSLSKFIWQNQSQLTYLKHLKMFNCIIKDGFPQVVYRIAKFAPNLQTLDFRNCKAKSQIKDQLQKMKSEFQMKDFNNSQQKQMQLQNIGKVRSDFSLI